MPPSISAMIGLSYDIGNLVRGEMGMGLHAAVDSAIGYYFQGAYALVRILSLDSEDAAISIETREDVVLEGPNPTLHQLKHSLSPGVLSEQNDGFWKTLRIWSGFLHEPNINFQFVTTALIKDGSALLELTKEEPDHALVLSALDTEADRVRKSREESIAQKEKPGYGDRWPGCETYLGLSLEDRQRLLRRIKITPSSFSAADIPAEVGKRLNTISHTIRGRVTERLIEWWDRQVALSLLKKRERVIKRSELLYQLQDISTSFAHTLAFPDDYSHLSPPRDTAPSRNIRLQIELVKGSKRLIDRATVEHWKARTQRRRWIDDGLPVVDSLIRFDQKLVDEWKDRHEELREKVSSKEQEPCEGGRALLDWSHKNAPLELPPIVQDWNQPHLVRGSYQLLAESLAVGWHPDFESLMKADDDEPEE